MFVRIQVSTNPPIYNIYQMPSGDDGVRLEPSGTGVYERVVYSKDAYGDRLARYNKDADRTKNLARYNSAAQNMIPIRTSHKHFNNGGSRIDDAGLLSFVTYSWVFQYLLQALRGKMDRDQVWSCSFYDSCGLNMARIEVLWEEERARNPKSPSLFKVIYRFISTRLWFSCAVFLFCLIFGFIGPTCFIRRLIAFTENPERDEELNIVYSYGVVLVIAIGLVEFARVLSYGATWAVSYRTGIRVRGAVLALLYKKVLDSKDLCGKTPADVVNIFANDGQRLFDAVTFAPLVIVGPLVLFGGVAYLLAVIGRWSLLGIAVFFIFDAIQFCLGKTMVNCRNEAIKRTEERIGLMSEIIRFIRVIKVSGWEDVFSKKVETMRHSEKIVIRKSGYAQSLAIACGPVVPVVAAVLTFLGVVLAGNDLLASDAFSAITVYFVMLFGIRMIPYGSRYLAESVVAMRRIQEYLVLESWDSFVAGGDSEYVVTCKEGFYTYQPEPEDEQTGTEKETLDKQAPAFGLAVKDLKIKRGDHVAVVGSVGSGKSALLKAISGHMFSQNTDMIVDRQNLAYVPQTPWIVNGTVQDNILFGDKMSSERYYKVVCGTQLTEDLSAFSIGDRTEIGERGTTLSGGQKARISLARATYAMRNLYLFDDVLASLDRRVADGVFQQIIENFLHKKTVVFVTNNMEVLEKFDRVLFMEAGNIVADGTHDQLYEDHPAYKQFVDACQGDDGNRDNFDTTLSLPLSSTIEEEFEKVGAPAAHDSSENIVQHLERDILISDEEDLGTSKLSFKIYMTYINAAGRWPIWTCLVVGFIINVVANIFSTFWLARWLKKGHDEDIVNINGTEQIRSLKSMAENENLTFYTVVYAISLVILTISGLFKACVFVKVSLDAASKLHNSMFNALLRGSIAFFDSTPTGRILNRFSKDMDEIDVKLPFTAEIFLQNMITCLGFLIVICYIFPLFLIACIPLFLIFVLFVSCFRAGIRNLKRSEHLSRSPLFDHVTTSLEGIASIHTMNQTQRFLEQLKKHLDANNGAVFMFQSAMRWLAVWLDLLVVVMTAIVAFLTVMLTGTVSPADAGMAITFAVQMSGIFQFAVRTQTELEAKMTSVERVAYYAENIRSDGDFDTKQGVDMSNSDIVQKLPLALNDISFEILSGEKIGIIGRTGSGKSSIASVICRLYPLTWGRIFIDGVDITTVGLTKLRRSISTIPQDPSLFSGTVRFNLDPSNDFSDSEIWAALKKCQIDEVVSGLENKLEGEVRTGGENFSVGEKQLFCLARALLTKSRIVILDEATASVDFATDKIIQNVIRESFKDATVLTIAHRLENVRKMDRVLFMENGKIVDFTTPDELFSKGWADLKRFAENGSGDSESAVVVDESNGQSSPEVLDLNSANSNEDDDSIVQVEQDDAEPEGDAKESSSDPELEVVEKQN
ncbi:unnamed protein product [Caenorhabditis angaria]|uniref:Uncharacterized protein n=1 Tax=Caenorhabditis angaria TaxID=860376 RepID=A0A9P1J230_9PELO|nr:unnamed protein product [Caenorhabditis angaria]